jgi:hypothetical protein
VVVRGYKVGLPFCPQQHQAWVIQAVQQQQAALQQVVGLERAAVTQSVTHVTRNVSPNEKQQVPKHEQWGHQWGHRQEQDSDIYSL